MILCFSKCGLRHALLLVWSDFMFFSRSMNAMLDDDDNNSDLACRTSIPSTSPFLGGFLVSCRLSGPTNRSVSCFV